VKLESVRDTLLDQWKDSIAAFLPARHVRRGLVDPATLPLEQIQAGVICLVATGGGSFANYQGREGELGTVRVKAIGFVLVPERSEKDDVERAELALLEDLLSWVGERKDPPLDCIYPGDYTQSGQLEHPAGWFVLDLEARNV
jgi:hypothetical protein